MLGRKFALLLVIVSLLLLLSSAFGQGASSSPTQSKLELASVPRLVKFSGRVDSAAGIVGITFTIYPQQTGGAPLWLETQSVAVDQNGRFSIYLGANHAQGLPVDLFASGEARWLGVQAEGQPEQPRVLLVSVPYALKAADADTLGGKPLSAFMLAPSATSSTTVTGGTYVNTAAVTAAAYTISGTAGALALFTSSSDLASANVFQSGDNIGIGIATPQRALHIRSAAPVIKLEDTNFPNGWWELQQSAFINETFGFLRYENPGGAIESKSFVISKTGNMGVGVGTPVRKLHLKSAGQTVIRLEDTNYPNSFWELQDAAFCDDCFGFLRYESGSAVPAKSLLITNTGNFGIGTSAPTAKLDVAGTINATAFTGNGAGLSFPTATVGTLTTTGDLALPDTTGAGVGVLTVGGRSFLHDYGSYTNAFVGARAGGSFTATGSQNTGVGFQSLYSLTSGTNNSALGYGSMYANTTGYGNSAFGSNSLNSNTTGYLNSAFGREALFSNTAAYGNSAFGYESLYSNTANLNSAFGIQSLVSNTTGSGNSAFGANALWANSTGSGNTAVGSSALTAATTANGNIAVGDTALGSTTIGNNNVAMGFHALWKNTTATGNTGMGYYSLSSNTIGQYNTGIGDSALAANTSGNNNTALGRYAGLYNATGSNNVYLGYNAGPDNSHTALTNTIAIGYSAVPVNSNTMILGGTGANAVNVGIGTSTPAQALSVVGTVESTSGGFKFPDATTQTTAVTQAGTDARYLQLTGGTMNSTGVTINHSSAATTSGLTINSSSTSQYGLHVVESGYNGIRVDGTMNWANIYSVNTASGSAWGVSGIADSSSGSGVTGSSNQGWGVVARTLNGIAVKASVTTGGTGVAGDFTGNVAVHGTLSKTAGSFKIDHPLDPEHKYLSHSFVESPDMKNVYDGVVVLDGAGEAVVPLPEWFGALNRDFRYQLTAIGAPGPNLYIAEKIANNRFKVAGGKPGAEVSWQVTGIRQDAYANAHRIPVEEIKSAEEQGTYLHPAEFGASPEKYVGYEHEQVRSSLGSRE